MGFADFFDNIQFPFRFVKVWKGRFARVERDTRVIRIGRIEGIKSVDLSGFRVIKSIGL
jgi:hypothetical protein